MVNLENDTIRLVTEYYTGNTTLFDDKDPQFTNLLLCYATDNNSSTLRELSTLYFLGYESNPNKHGYDGIDNKTGREKEVKPRYIEAGKKVGGSGNFNDMTLELLEAKRHQDIICSLFCDNRLIYIVEFPMEVIYEHIKQPIIKAKIGRRIVCGFGWKQYNSPLLKVHYFDSISAAEKGCLSKGHFKMLMERLPQK